MAYNVNNKKKEGQEMKKSFQTYNFVFRHKEYGFEDYKSEKFAIENKINKQLDDINRLSKNKISVFKTDTSPFAEDTKITITFKNVDRKTAKKIAELNSWKLLKK